jgi:hypothetical protein
MFTCLTICFKQYCICPVADFFEFSSNAGRKSVEKYEATVFVVQVWKVSDQIQGCVCRCTSHYETQNHDSFGSFDE